MSCLSLRLTFGQKPWLKHGCSGRRMRLEAWNWMLWSPYALGTRMELWLGHGCSGRRMLLEHERNWHGCSGHRMLLEHERNYGLGMDALVTECSWNTNGIMAWAWMLWSPYALGTRTELWFGHGCSGRRMLFEHERNYGLGMDALVAVCCTNTNGIMVWAWMLWSPYALWNTNGIMVWACMLWSSSALGTRTELRSGRSLQVSTPALKVLERSLAMANYIVRMLAAQPRELRATFGPKKPRNAGLRNVSDMCVSAARRLVGVQNNEP